MEFSNKFSNLLLGFRYTRDEGDQEPLGSMYKKVLQIAWPAALEGLLLTLMNSFDTMMVGKLGPAAITSVGLCAQPRMIILLVAQAICTGTMAVIARRKGEGRQDQANSCLRQSLLLVTFIGILMTALGILLATPLLKLAGGSEETLSDAVIYFRVISMAFIPNCWAICICSAMRGIGKTRITMVVNVSANLVNIFLNYCLISGHLGFPALGVRGAAIATAIGTCVSSVIAIIVVMRKSGYLSLRPFKGFRFDRATLGSIIKVGSGTILESVCMRIGFLLNGKLIAGVGTAAFAASQIVGQVSSLTFCLGDGVSSACTSLVGQSLGANTKKKAMAYVRVGERISIFMSVAIMLFYLLRAELAADAVHGGPARHLRLCGFLPCPAFRHLSAEHACYARRLSSGCGRCTLCRTSIPDQRRNPAAASHLYLLLSAEQGLPECTVCLHRPLDQLRHRCDGPLDPAAHPCEERKLGQY